MKDLIEKTDDKRERILLAAVEVFTCRGYSQARIEEIAETAGIGKGTLYEYFDSKLQLFHEMVTRSWEEYTISLTMDSIQGLNFEQTILTIVQRHFTFSKRSRKLARMLIWDTEIMDEELREWLNQRREEQKILIEQIVDRAMRKGEIKKVDSMLVYTILGGLIGSIWAINILDDWEIDPETLADQLTSVIMDGIRR